MPILHLLLRLNYSQMQNKSLIIHIWFGIFFNSLACRVTKIRNSKYLKVFGRNLYKLRIERGLSQEQLANDADMPINQIGRIERGEINTTISTAYALSDALKIEIKELFDFAFIKNG